MLNPGQILDGKYEIIKVLGQGGMGTVYLCRNRRLGNLWAVKEINSQWQNKVDFLAEPNILKNLSHPGIVRIFDIFYENDYLYIIEDYIEGRTLKEYVAAKGPLPSELVKNIATQLCSILNYLHSLKPPIIYRDLKPTNIMIKPDNQVVLIDFGIARTYKESQMGDTVVLGSRGYIAPEQLINVQSNAQTDIYSLGVTMFFMLTGKPISQSAELMSDKNYPENTSKGLVRIIKKASAIEPGKRYSSVKSMISELNSISAHEEYTRTMLMNSNVYSPEVTRKVSSGNNKQKKRSKLVIIGVLACITALAIFSALYLGNNSAAKNAANAAKANTTNKNAGTPSDASKTSKKPEPALQPPKEVQEKETVITGVIDAGSPVVSGPDHGIGKARGRQKNESVQYILNPAASYSDSNVSITLNSIVITDHEVTAILNIQNKGTADMKLDLSKTYLTNGKNQAAKTLNQNNQLSIPQGSSPQELKLHFSDFRFEGSTYTLKTVLCSDINKDINLNIDIKGKMDK